MTGCQYDDQNELGNGQKAARKELYSVPDAGPQFKKLDEARDPTEQVARQSPDAILILVTNPLDAMCWTALTVSRFPGERVIGMAGLLDSARFRTFIASELDVSFENVTEMVLGGDSDRWSR